MTHLFIINPAAGSRNRTDDYSEAIHRICREKGVDYEVRVSTAPGECSRIAREAAETGKEYRIYACGGDADGQSGKALPQRQCVFFGFA